MEMSRGSVSLHQDLECRLAGRLASVRPSPTIAVTRQANKLRRQGKDIIGLSQSEPDFDTPQPIKEAAKLAIDRSKTKYKDVDGTPEMKRAIVRKFESQNELEYAPSQISVGAVGKQVIYNALMAALDPGECALTCERVSAIWALYFLPGARVKTKDLPQESRLRFD